jgi:hypothetical protein
MRPIRALIGDIINHAINHAPCTPRWKRLYLELDSAKPVPRIAVAQSVILDQIEDGFSKPSDGTVL